MRHGRGRIAAEIQLSATTRQAASNSGGDVAREFAETLERDLENARTLLEQGHSEMALVRAVASFEWFMKEAFIEPHLRTTGIDPGGELADMVVDALIRRGSGWNEMSRLLRTFWKIDTGKLPAWKDFIDVYRLRSRIVHAGARCEAREARSAIDTCTSLLRALLPARIEAQTRPC